MNKPIFLPHHILLALAWGMIAGTGLGVLYLLSISQMIIVFLAAVFVWFLWRQKRSGIFVFLFLVALVFALWRTKVLFSAAFVPVNFFQPLNRGTVISEPKIMSDHQEFTVALDGGEGKRGDHVLLKTRLYPEVWFGDQISFSCRLRNYDDEEGFWKYYWKMRGISAGCFSYKITRLNQGLENATSRVKIQNFVMKSLFSLKASMIQRIQRRLPEPEASFLAALLIGARNGLPDDIQESFRRAGVSHILALSGFNITVLLMSVKKILPWIGITRKRAWLASLVVVVMFVLAAGGQGSLLRASLMGVYLLMAETCGRQKNIGLTLLVSAAVITAFQPLALFFDIGFQLSFAATAGLLYGSETIETWFHFFPKHFGLRSVFSQSLSATLATFPLAAWNFGSVSVLGLFSNVFIVPLVPLAMGFGFLFVILDYGSHTLSLLAIFPAWFFLRTMRFVAEVFAQPSWAVISVSRFDVFLICVAMIFMVMVFRQKK